MAAIKKRGNSYYTMVDLPKDATGARRQRRITAATKREVDTLRSQLLASISTGGFAEADAKKITVAEYLAQWLASTEQGLRPASYRRYQDLVRLHISPQLGQTQLAKLSALHIQHLYTHCLNSGKSPTTVGLIHVVLYSALKQAVKWKLLAQNPAQSVDVPRRITKEFATWNAQEAATFLAIADADELAALWRLSLLTGMRRGEMLGLKWADLDLSRGLLSVKRTLSRGADGGFVLGEPKTPHSKRTIVLPPSAVESLKRHRLKQIEARWAFGSDYADLDLVFADATGRPLHPNTLRTRFRRLIDAAGVPMLRLHDLRHSSATLMMANGVNPKIVSERLGHANIGITLGLYSHVSEDMQRDAANGLDTLIEGAS